MRLAQAWRRRGMWATAATLVVPGTLAVAVAVTLLSGGLRGLGAAGQVVTGPSIPESALTGAHGRSRSSVRLPTVPAARAAVVPAAPAGPGASAPAGGSPLAVAPPRHRQTTVSLPVSGPRTSSPAPSGSPPPRAPERPNPVRDAGEGVAHTVGTLPPPAGPAGQDAVTTVVEIIPPPLATTLPPAGGPAAPARPAVPLPSVPVPSVPTLPAPLPAVPTPAIPALPVH